MGERELSPAATQAALYSGRVRWREQAGQRYRMHHEAAQAQRFMSSGSSTFDTVGRKAHLICSPTRAGRHTGERKKNGSLNGTFNAEKDVTEKT